MSGTGARPRRTQRERTEATTGQLLAAARELFARDGYAATSLDDVTAAAQVTKGALYHHFSSKRELFRAVCAVEQERLTRRQSEAFRSQDDPWQGFAAGCEAYLEGVSEPGVQRILLLDAPGVLGWEGIRELEAQTHAMSIEGVRRAMSAKRLPRRDPAPLVELVFGALGAAAMAIARAPTDDAAAVRRAMAREIRRLLDGLAVSDGPSAPPPRRTRR